jgi:hypothetical protein
VQEGRAVLLLPQAAQFVGTRYGVPLWQALHVLPEPLTVRVGRTAYDKRFLDFDFPIRRAPLFPPDRGALKANSDGFCDSGDAGRAVHAQFLARSERHRDAFPCGGGLCRSIEVED